MKQNKNENRCIWYNSIFFSWHRGWKILPTSLAFFYALSGIPRHSLYSVFLRACDSDVCLIYFFKELTHNECKTEEHLSSNTLYTNHDACYQRWFYKLSRCQNVGVLKSSNNTSIQFYLISHALIDKLNFLFWFSS